MSSYENRLSALVSAWVPEFVREYGPNFVAFIEAWVEWMQEERGIVAAHLNALDWKDIDGTLDDFVEFFHDEFMPSIPRRVLTDRRLLLKHIRSFYRAKGSQKAYRLLFRILFDEEIEFYYPGRDILRVSGARWVVERTVTVAPYDIDFDYTSVRQIAGSASGASALVEGSLVQMAGGVQQTVLSLSNVTKPFEVGDNLTSNDEIIGRVLSYTVHPGRYDGTYGFISSNKYLQGPHYYQEFSYVIKSGQPLTAYKEFATRLVHPAGTKLFGQVDMQLEAFIAPVFVTGVQREVELLYTTVEVVPVVVTTTEFGDASAVDELRLEYLASPAVELAEGYLSRLLSLTGSLASANLPTPNDFSTDPPAKYASWSPADFTSGRGIIGTGTLFTSETSAGRLITIHVSGEDDFLGSIGSVDSDTTMLVQPAHPAAPFTGATAETEVDI